MCIAILVSLATVAANNIKQNTLDTKVSTVIAAVNVAKSLYEVNATGEQKAAFSVASNDDQFTMIQPFLTINGCTAPSKAELLEKTGKHSLHINDFGIDPVLSN